MTAAVSFAEDMLRQHADAWRALSAGRPSPPHQQSFIFEDWLLQHGEACGPLMLKRPKGLRLGKIKNCFQNSFSAVFNHQVDSNEWFYTEGVVLRQSLPITIHHAWLTNRSGEVIDLTLRDPASDESYFGIPMTPDYVEKKTFEHGYYGLFSGSGCYNRDILETIEEGRAWPKAKAAAKEAA